MGSSTEIPPSGATRLTASDRHFIESRLPGVVGWLHPDAAYFTTYLMGLQAETGIRGPALEYGVYHGKYLSLMMNACLKQDEWVGGFDTFELCHPETAWKHAEEFFGSRERMALWKGSTANYDAAAVSAMIGAPPRIISVDGDHTAEGALHDLQLAANVMLRRGIVAADDIYNPFAIGVSEGAFRFLLAKDCPLVPFAQIANKTMLCQRAEHAFYFAGAAGFVQDCADLSVVATFRENRQQGENWVIQRLLSVDVMIFS